MTASIITIGDEILIGQIVDTNSAWISRELSLNGVEVLEQRSVSDDSNSIIHALSEVLNRVDLVLITGGLGPTKDDVTKKTLVEFTKDKLVFHDETYQGIKKLIEKLNRNVTEGHRLQSFMPAKAEIMRNKMGTAPGMWLVHEGKSIISLPGVPYEMKYLMTNEVLPRIRDRFDTKQIIHQVLSTIGDGESRIADKIQDIEEGLPKHIKLAYLPGLGRVKLRLSGSGKDLELLRIEIKEWSERICDRIPDLVYALEDMPIEKVVGQMLKESGKQLVLAESCTGGYISHLITSIPGSSDYYLGGIVAYDNRVKSQLLGVDPAIIQRHGAVSEEVVRAMALGALKQLKANVSLSVSGIAGPGGGTPDKPVGSIWLAVSDGKNTHTRFLSLGKDRINNIKYTASVGLNMIRQLLNGLDDVHILPLFPAPSSETG